MNIIEKIKVLLALNKSFDKIKREAKKEVVMSEDAKVVKPGWKTTEFWLTALAEIGTLIGALRGVIPAETAGIIIAIQTAIYNILRTIAKK